MLLPWIIVLFSLFWTSTVARREKIFRKHYTYIPQYDSSFKIHNRVDIIWDDVLHICNDEQASLFRPYTKGEWSTVVRPLLNLWEEQEGKINSTELFVGVYETPPAEIHIRIGLPEPNAIGCVVMNLKTAKIKNKDCDKLVKPLLFICKKSRDTFCPTLDKGYVYINSLRKCYKINNIPKTWQGAMEACFTEGGMLAAMDPVESKTIREIMNDQDYFVGNHALSSTYEYFHVKGENIHAKFGKSPGNCVNFSRNIKSLYAHTTCDARLPFICEMEVAV